MPLLSKPDVEQYKPLKLSDAKTFKARKKALDSMTAFENQLYSTGRDYGLPYFIAINHHAYGLSIRRIATMLGVYASDVLGVLRFYGIPNLTQPEASRKVVIERWKDPEFVRKIPGICRKSLERLRNEDFDFTVNQSEGARAAMEKINANKRLMKKRAKAVEDMWRNKEFRKKQAAAASKSSKKRWEMERIAKGMETAISDAYLTYAVDVTLTDKEVYEAISIEVGIEAKYVERLLKKQLRS